LGARSDHHLVRRRWAYARISTCCTLTNSFPKCDLIKAQLRRKEKKEMKEKKRRERERERERNIFIKPNKGPTEERKKREKKKKEDGPIWTNNLVLVMPIKMRRGA
jgi:hypothetical protein